MLKHSHSFLLKLKKKKKSNLFPSINTLRWQWKKKCNNGVRKRKDWVLSERHKSGFNGLCHQSRCDEDFSCRLLRSRHPQPPFILSSSRLRTRPRGCWIRAHRLFRALRQRDGALERPPSSSQTGGSLRLCLQHMQVGVDPQQQRTSWRGQRKFDVCAL